MERARGRGAGCNSDLETRHGGRNGGSNGYPTLANFLKDPKDYFFPEGITVVDDLQTVRLIHSRLAKYMAGLPIFFLTRWTSTPLTKGHFEQLETAAYFVAYRPLGYTCFFYINDMGEVFILYNARLPKIYQMEEKYANDLFLLGRQHCKDTLLVVVIRICLKKEDDTEDDERIPDVETKRKKICRLHIIDAIRVAGQDITHLSIDERVASAKEKVMKPKLDATLNQQELSEEEQETFGLYIVDYVRINQAEAILSAEYQERLGCRKNFLYFIPENQENANETSTKIFSWGRSLTLNFRLDEGKLLLLDGSTEVPYATIALTDDIRKRDRQIIQCEFKGGKWVFVRESRCTKPDIQKFVMDKLHAAQHPVTIKDLQNFFRKLARQSPTFGGFSEIDYVDTNATFFEGVDVKGVRLLTDSQQVRNARSKLEECAYGSCDFYDAQWPVEMSKKHLVGIVKRQFSVTFHPEGQRMILYANSDGEILFETVKSRQLFTMEHKSALKLIKEDGRIVKDTVLEGVVTRVTFDTDGNAGESDPSSTGKLTFFITDATLCDGVDVTDKTIRERLDFVEAKIMIPRREASKRDAMWNATETINLQMTPCKQFCHADCFLGEQFGKLFNDYPFSSLLFYPYDFIYSNGTKWAVLTWRENGTPTFALRLKVPEDPTEVEGQLYAREDIKTEILFGKIALTDEIRQMDNRIIDCVFDGDLLKYTGLRRDLHYPDNIGTVHINVEAQKTPVARRDLLDAVEKNLAYWTERQSITEITSSTGCINKTQTMDRGFGKGRDVGCNVDSQVRRDSKYSHNHQPQNWRDRSSATSLVHNLNNLPSTGLNDLPQQHYSTRLQARNEPINERQQHQRFSNIHKTGGVEGMMQPIRSELTEMEGTRGRGGGRGFGGSHHGPRSGNQTHYNSRGGRSSYSTPKAPNFDRIDRETKFFDGENVEGVSLLTDLDLTKEIRYRLGKFCHGTSKFFPAMWPVSLSPANVRMLSSTSYVVVPKPVGPRFLMYIDTAGTVYLENMTQHVFCVDEDHQIKMVRRDGQPIKDTVLDGIITRQKTEDSSEEDPLKTSGRLTFCIQDAIRCNGEDLTGMGILERIAFVQEELMKPRLDALNQNKTSQENEAFTMDIAEYKDAHNAEEYLSPDFKDYFKYPYRALVFVPKREGYKSGTCHRLLHWAEDDDQECSFLLKIPIDGVKPKEGELYVGGPGRSMIEYCKIPITDEIQEFNGKIIDCKYADNQWVFVKARNDRHHPNGRRTVVDKQKTLEHPVTRDLLLTTLDESKGRN